MKKDYLEIGYKIYCSEHKHNRDITCEKCNKAVEYNCWADALESSKKNLINKRSWTTTTHKLYDKIVKILLDTYWFITTEKYPIKDFREQWAKSLAKRILDEILEKEK